MNKFVTFTLFITLGVFYACMNESKESAINKDELMHKARSLFMTPDSLRSDEDKILFNKIEAIFYEECPIRNGRFEISVSENEWKRRGLPEIYYKIMKKDIEDTNNYINALPLKDQQSIFDSFHRAKEEFLAREKSRK